MILATLLFHCQPYVHAADKNNDDYITYVSVQNSYSAVIITLVLNVQQALDY